MSTIYKATYVDDNPIVHWRTKGSKNGIRLWQNPDGSYTEAGRNFKIGGRYNSSSTGERLSRADIKAAKSQIKSDRAEAKNNAKVTATRNKNASTNDEIAKRIPYSRDDLSDYEKQQELALMNNQLKYLKDIREYQKENESGHFEKVARDMKKELKSMETKMYIGFAVGALGITAAYIANQNGIDGKAFADTVVEGVSGKYGKIFTDAAQAASNIDSSSISNGANQAFKSAVQTAGKVKDKVAAVIGNGIDTVKGAKSTAVTTTSDPGKVTYTAAQWVKDNGGDESAVEKSQVARDIMRLNRNKT